MLPETCGMAFKEWAVIVAALARGQQTLILRKGGIHEGREGFRVEHPWFWLFPTYLHQDEEWKLAEPAWPVLQDTIRTHRKGVVLLQYLAEATDVVSISDEKLSSRLQGTHWWSEQTLHDRFHYRQAGLFLLMVRIYKAAAEIELPDLPKFAGCRSWIELPQPIPVASLVPVIPEPDFLARRQEILGAIGALAR